MNLKPPLLPAYKLMVYLKNQFISILMNYSEAEASIEEHKYVLGRRYKGQEVAALIIAPETGERIFSLVNHFVTGDLSEELYPEGEALMVVALLDIEDWFITGTINWKKLTDIVDSLDEEV